MDQLNTECKQHKFKLQNTHAASQNPGKKQEDFQYKCLWKGCKVFGRASSSKSWLEKHVAGHVDGGQKPFQVQYIPGFDKSTEIQ